MEKVQSKYDAETIYKVTDNAVTISRNGDEMKFPIYLIPVVANPLPLPQEIKDELFEFFDKKYPEVSCSICGKPMRQIHGKKYCSDECSEKAKTLRNKARYTAKLNGVEKVCACCGKKFVLYANFHSKYCSDECRKNAIAIQREAQASERRTAYQKAKTKKKKDPYSLSKLNKEARSKGLTYGQLQAQRYIERMREANETVF